MNLVTCVLLTALLATLHVDALERTLALGAAPQKCEFDIGLLIDSSSSITSEESGGEKNWGRLLRFLKDFVKHIKTSYPEVRLAMNTFAGNNVIRFNWADSTNVDYMLKKIDEMKGPQGGDTYMKKAFIKMRDDIFGNSGNRKKVRDLMLFMTDGKPNPDSENPLQIAEEMKRNGLSILGLGITDKVDRDLMVKVTHPNYFLPVKSYTELEKKVDSIVKQACTPLPSECHYDIGLLVDSSSSITQGSTGGYENWKHLLTFLRDFVTEVSGRYPEAHIAMLTFANNNIIRWQWKDGKRKDEMLNIINGMKGPMGGETYMKNAFQMMEKDVFGNHGNRNEITDLMIFMTDGKPNPEATQNPLEIANRMKADGVQILGLGITDDVDKALMQKVVTNNAYLHIDNFKALTSEVMRIIGLGCRKST